MAFRAAINQRAAASAATGVLAATVAFYPRRAHAESPERESIQPHRRPIYDDDADSVQRGAADRHEGHATETVRRVAPQTTAAASPTPTDRLEKYVRAARLELYEVAKKGEEGVNDFMTGVLKLENSVAQTVADLAPSQQSREKLMPGLIYVLVASMAGSIVTRRSNILLRATVPLALGVGTAYRVIPVTTHNVESLIWRFEEKYPPVRDTHLQVRQQLVYYWETSKAHSGILVERVEESLEGARKKMQDWVRQGK